MQDCEVNECFKYGFNIRKLLTFDGQLEENRKPVGAEIQDRNRENRENGPVLFNIFLLTVK